jgi:enoyl-CoA hydratase
MMDQAVRNVQDDDAPIRAVVQDGVGIIELSRPAVFNCLSQQMLGGIADAIAAFERDGARAILIAASGKNFCTGAALDEVEAVRGDVAELRAFLALGHSVLDRLEASPLPVVAAVQGL